MTKTIKQIEAAARTSSLQTTIGEIEKFLGSTDPNRPTDNYREFLNKTLGDFAELWLRRGYKAAHNDVYEKFEKNNSKFPKSISHKVKKGAKKSKLAPDHERELILSSKIKI